MGKPRERSGGLVVFLLVLVLVMGAGAAGAIEIFPIARESGHQQYPAVDNTLVAWQHDQGGDSDLGIVEISSLNSIAPMTFEDSFSDAQRPAVSGGVVVWQSKSFMQDDWDVVGFDYTTETFFTVMSTYQDERRPAICGTLVVAEARTTAQADCDVLGADISRRSEPQLFWVDASAADQCRPDISDGFVVYEDAYSGTQQLYGADLTDLDDIAWFPIFTGAGSRRHPAIAGRWVVWEDDAFGKWAIAGDNVFHPRLPDVLQSSDAHDCLHADVYNNVVVWQDYRNGNWDIYGYNPTTKTSFQITSNNRDQTHPAITFNPDLNGYVVVWQDYRKGNWDIYGAYLDGPEVAGCASPLPSDVNADSVVDEKDLDQVEADQGKRNGIPPTEN